MIQALVSLILTSAFAAQLTGRVVNVIPDDEGLKVITQERRVELGGEKAVKKDVKILYVKTSNKDFQAISKQLEEAKTSKNPLLIDYQAGSMFIIDKVQAAKP